MIALDLQKSLKYGTEFLYISHLVFPLVNILHHCGTLVITKKPTLTRHLLTSTYYITINRTLHFIWISLAFPNIFVLFFFQDITVHCHVSFISSGLWQFLRFPRFDNLDSFVEYLIWLCVMFFPWLDWSNGFLRGNVHLYHPRLGLVLWFLSYQAQNSIPR